MAFDDEEDEEAAAAACILDAIAEAFAKAAVVTPGGKNGKTLPSPRPPAPPVLTPSPSLLTPAPTAPAPATRPPAATAAADTATGSWPKPLARGGDGVVGTPPKEGAAEGDEGDGDSVETQDGA